MRKAITAKKVARRALLLSLNATPTRTLCGCSKYPQARFPYEELRREDAAAHDPEYEILDTGIFAQNVIST